jgi:hypothetical protein
MEYVTNFIKPEAVQPLKEENGKKVLTLTKNVNETFYKNFVHLYTQCSINDDIIIELTTLGGEITWAYMISKIIQRHKGETIVRVPYYAFSSGTIIALSANRIVLSNIGCLGPIDPYIFGLNVPTSSKVLNEFNKEKTGWIKWMTTGWTNVLMNYGNIMLKRIDDDHQRLIKNLLKKYNKTEEIYEFFTHANHHQTPIYFEDIPEYLDVSITVDDDLFTKPTDNKDTVVPKPTDNKNSLGPLFQSLLIPQQTKPTDNKDTVFPKPTDNKDTVFPKPTDNKDTIESLFQLLNKDTFVTKSTDNDHVKNMFTTIMKNEPYFDQNKTSTLTEDIHDSTYDETDC